jgi:hypothetical protein
MRCVIRPDIGPDRVSRDLLCYYLIHAHCMDDPALAGSRATPRCDSHGDWRLSGFGGGDTPARAVVNAEI